MRYFLDNNKRRREYVCMKKGYIGVYEFCRRTGRDITSVYKLIYQGSIPAKKLGARNVWHIAESEVSNWILERPAAAIVQEAQR